ncbi:efflux RND transporter periplasmic adaptor subunit [uncultured Clostridium sp.]|uniref:efflux RND transporter periplasmic adaptor subunit n=1 Tax=uncultured Clostridium sp. TaxID=59620 RepID=UPI00260CF841|nr:efflux RND transporter periplasmic adaptor subunit [uncultured Clostridium sp.]
MKRGKLVVVLATISIILVGGITLLNNKNESKVSEKKVSSSIAVETFLINNSSIEKFKKFTGITIAGESEVVTPKALSNILAIKVKEGDYVKKGQVIMTLDSTSIDKQISELDSVNNKLNETLETNKQKLEEVKTQKNEESLKKIEIEEVNNTTIKANEDIDVSIVDLNTKLENKEIDIEEHKLSLLELNKKKTENTAIINKNNMQIKTLDMTITALDKTIEQMETIFSKPSNNEVSDMLNGLKDKKGNYSVVSGINGVIKEINLKVGEMPISLMKPGILIENDSSLDIEFQVDKEDLKLFKTGMKIDVFVDKADSQEQKQGIIESIGTEVDERTKQYKVKVAFENGDKSIKIGDFTKVLIPTEVKEDVVSIPKDAIIREDGKTFVYVSEKNKSVKKEITVGIENHKDIEVKSGLKALDKVIIKGKEFISDGVDINIVKEVKKNEDN